MRMRTKGSGPGFTVLEAMIAMTLFLAVLGAVMATFAPGRQLYNRGEKKAEVQQNARLAVGDMARQIRLAGYFPENVTLPPPTTLVADPILIATDRVLAIHGDADGSGSSQVFLFCLDGTDLRRRRGPRGSSSSFVCSTGELIAEEVEALRFAYYDADGNPVPDPPTTPYQLDSQGPGAVPDVGDTSQRSQIRQDLRAVQRDLDRSIESLGTVLKAINIILVPAILILLVLVAAWRRNRRQSA